jgi:hypothetical protein
LHKSWSARCARSSSAELLRDAHATNASRPAEIVRLCGRFDIAYRGEDSPV